MNEQQKALRKFKLNVGSVCTDCPCINCQERTIECHSKCKKYQKYKENVKDKNLEYEKSKERNLLAKRNHR